MDVYPRANGVTAQFSWEEVAQIQECLDQFLNPVGVVPMYQKVGQLLFIALEKAKHEQFGVKHG